MSSAGVLLAELATATGIELEATGVAPKTDKWTIFQKAFGYPPIGNPSCATGLPDRLPRREGARATAPARERGSTRCRTLGSESRDSVDDILDAGVQ